MSSLSQHIFYTSLHRKTYRLVSRWDSSLTLAGEIEGNPEYMYLQSKFAGFEGIIYVIIILPYYKVINKEYLEISSIIDYYSQWWL